MLMLPRGKRRGGGAAGGGHEESDEKASARGKGLPIPKYLFSSIDQLAYMKTANMTVYDSRVRRGSDARGRQNLGPSKRPALIEWSSV